jgi:Domain of unknown function (DUF4190)
LTDSEHEPEDSQPDTPETPGPPPSDHQAGYPPPEGYPPRESYPPPQHPPSYTAPGGYPPPPGHPQYAPPPPYYAPPVPLSRGTNGFSIASLVLGIIWVWWIGSILALVFGYIAKSQIDKSGGQQGGRGMAIAGIVLGWIGIGTLVLVIVLVAIGSASEPY